MDYKRLDPAEGLDGVECYQEQKKLDAAKRELDSKENPTDAERIQSLFLGAVSVCEHVLFTLPEGVTIAAIQEQIPDLEVLAQVGTAYAVSIPATDASLGKFVKEYSHLPDPNAEELEALSKALKELFSNGPVGLPVK